MYLSWQKHYYYFIVNRDLFVKNKNYPFRCNLKYEEIDIWWNTPYQILTVYRGFLAQTPWGVANF